MDEKEICQACRRLEQSLMAALKRGDAISFATKSFSKPLFDSDGGYGMAPVDALYTGVRFTIEIGEPAEKREAEALKRRLGHQR